MAEMNGGPRSPGTIGVRAPALVKHSGLGMGAQQRQSATRVAVHSAPAAPVAVAAAVRPVSSRVEKSAAVAPRPPVSRATKTPPVLTQVRKTATPPSSAVWPNVSLPQSIPAKPAASASTPAAPHWKCSTCAKVLGPRCVAQGTGMILSNALYCIDCIKSGSKRARRPELSAKVIYGTVGGIAATLGAVAIFAPGQVLLLVLLVSVGSLFTALLGFTLSRAQRLSVAAAGIVALGLSTWGLIAVRAHAAGTQAVDGMSSEAAAVKTDLTHNCYFEATRRITSLRDRAMKDNANVIPPQLARQLDSLTEESETWLKANYGALSTDERELLTNLWRQFGSVTSTSAKRFSAVKISGSGVQLTAAIEITRADSHDRVKASGAGQSVECQCLEQAEPILRTVLKRHDISNVELTLVSADAGAQKLATLTLDAKAVSELRLGKWIVLRQALSSILQR